MFSQKFFEDVEIQSRSQLAPDQKQNQYFDSIFTDQNFQDVESEKSLSLIRQDQQEVQIVNELQKSEKSDANDNFSRDDDQMSKTVQKTKTTRNVDHNDTYTSDQNDEILQRSQKNLLFKSAYIIVSNKYFTTFIVMAIIGNTICLFLDRYPIPIEESKNLESINLLFFAIFFSEMLLKQCGFGLANYIRDQYNLFDMTIVMFSMTEIILMESSNSPNIQKALIAFRTMRFLRIFKIARQWRSLQIILQKMKKSFSEMLNFLVLLFIFIFIYALLGMELYSNLVKFDAQGRPVLCQEANLELCAEQGKQIQQLNKFFKSIVL